MATCSLLVLRQYARATLVNSSTREGLDFLSLRWDFPGMNPYCVLEWEPGGRVTCDCDAAYLYKTCIHQGAVAPDRPHGFHYSLPMDGWILGWRAKREDSLPYSGFITCASLAARVRQVEQKQRGQAEAYSRGRRSS